MSHNIARTKGLHKEKGDIIALKKEGGEEEMTELLCPKCIEKKQAITFSVRCTGSTKMWGIIQCTKCLHEMPFSVYHDHIQQLDIALPGTQSDQLNPSVPGDLKDDIKESERANYAQCHKACVAMCRRALQLGLIDKEIADGPLGGMLKQALSTKLLSQDIYNLATSIKGYGDIGTHRREQLEPEEVKMVIYATVRMLNELFR